MSDINQLGFSILSLVLWLPALGAVVLLALPRERELLHRQVALGASVAAFVVSLILPLTFDYDAGGSVMQFVDRMAWIPAWGVEYYLGIDGVSLWLVMLTTFIVPVTLLTTWDSIHTQVRYFLVLMLLLETAMMGVFMVLDLFLFYLFWEFTLIPMAFLIGIWGTGNKLYSAVKFFLYTFAGSVFMLVAIIALYVMHSNAVAPTFAFSDILVSLRSGALELDPGVQRALFGAFFAAFAIKVPLWPFHTWLPDAHVDAPTAGSVILAGVLLKLGSYGLIRFNLTLFPEASYWAAPAIGILAVIGILYGAAVAYAQTDMKKLVAYSSVSHMGFVVLGIFALNTIGISGATIQMVNHGLSTGALFLIVGIIYERRHTRELAAFNGLWKVMPVYGGLTLLVILSSAGLPGLNGFVGEFTIMQGAYLADVLGWVFVLFAVPGVVLAAVYLLRMFNDAFMGDVKDPANAEMPGLNRRELAALVLLSVPIVLIGIFPNLLFAAMQNSIADVVQNLSVLVAVGQ
jgi:NADH-quinone oxidoreductase subunit M